jgi:hypothetical protein
VFCVSPGGGGGGGGAPAAAEKAEMTLAEEKTAYYTVQSRKELLWDDQFSFFYSGYVPAQVIKSIVINGLLRPESFISALS